MEKEETQQEKALAKHLNKYIKDKHNQDECIGFIDGYEDYGKNNYTVIDDIPWSYWSDRCNWIRAYTIYKCYMNTDHLNLFEKLENEG